MGGKGRDSERGTNNGRDSESVVGAAAVGAAKEDEFRKQVVDFFKGGDSNGALQGAQAQGPPGSGPQLQGPSLEV